MSDSSPTTVTLHAASGELPSGPAASVKVRQVAAELFADFQPARLAAFLTVLDELVMDAQRHGSQLQEVHVCRFDEPAAAHAEVVSTPPAPACRVGGDAVDAALGRLLIEDLATAWGVEREGHNWMTWAEG